AAALAAVLWLYETSAGEAWRRDRMSTPDLIAVTLANPSDVGAQRALGEREMAEHHPEEAASAFAAALAAAPASADLRVRDVRALTGAGRPDEALDTLSSLLSAGSSSGKRDAEALCAAGEAYYALGALERATDLLRQGLEQGGSRRVPLAWAWGAYALALADSHAVDAARAAARRAVQEAPSSSRA